MNQQKKSENNNVTYIVLGAVCLFLLSSLFYGSNLPYVGYNSWNYNIYSLIAHNYNNLGFFVTKFAPVISVTSELSEKPIYYLNHPPLLSVLIAMVFRAIGETFWAGRLVNIVASFFSCVLLFSIAKELAGKMYATIVFVISTIIPATIIFGRMIGQESLVLFFALLFLYMFLLFNRTGKKVWLIIGMSSIVLGTLSDWVMVYFTLSILVFLIYKKEKKVALSIVAISVATSLFYLAYTYLITGDATFLFGGFLNRSTGELLHRGNWGVIWIITILLRLFVYFNPVIVGLAVLYFFRYRNNGGKGLFVLTASLFGFGMIHIILYPEGSYGHPYWTFYLFPAIALGSGVVVQKLWMTRKLIVILGLVLSSLYVMAVVQWKMKETIGNVFRYQLAKIASEQISDYTPILINRTGPIDPDIFQYSFHHPTVILEPNQKKFPDLPFGAVVFSCLPTCNGQTGQLSIFKDRYSGTRFLSQNLEMWMFTKDEKQKQEVKTERISVLSPKDSHSLFSTIYQKVMQLSSAPQL